MTELLKKEFSRKSFVKGGGAMVVGFSFAGAGLAGKARAAVSPYANSGPPPADAVDSFIVIHSDNTASIKTGIKELGQGSTTSLLMIAGEELNMEMSQLRFLQFDTAGPNVSPNTGNTGNSSAIRIAGPSVRAAAAYGKQALLGLAATQLGVAVSSLTVKGGVVSGGGRSVKYGELLGDKLFNVKMPRATLDPGQAPAKAVSDYGLVGTRVPRIDLPDKVTGEKTYIQNVRVPGMLHGRIVRPRGQGAYGTGAKPLKIDASSIKHLADVRVVRRGDFLGVVAPNEWVATQAAAQLKVTWQDPATVIPLPGSGNIFAAMRASQTLDRLVTNRGDVGKGFASAATVRSATFTGQHVSHAPIGPHCAIADVTANGAVIMSHLKNGYATRPRIAQLLGMPESVVRLQHWEGSSSFGGGAIYADAAEAAAVMSQIVGKPVRVQFMRWDEFGWDNYGSAQVMDVRGGIDAKGNLVAFDITGWITPENGSDRYATTETVGYGALDPGIGGRLVDGGANSASFYTTPNYRVIGKAKVWTQGILRIASLRMGGQSLNNFAAEQIIDELAYAANMDPLAFRLQNMTDSRWINPLTAAAQAANWQPRVANSVRQSGDVVNGRGIGFGFHSGGNAAGITEIEVNTKTGKILVKNIYMAQEQGLAVGIAQLENQIVGGSTQAASRALHEAIAFNKSAVTSLDWVTYPMMRFKEAPKVTPIVVQNTSITTQGAGEPMAGAVHAGIANAFFDATGVRMHTFPLTPARVLAALRSAAAKTQTA